MYLWKEIKRVCTSKYLVVENLNFLFNLNSNIFEQYNTIITLLPSNFFQWNEVLKYSTCSHLIRSLWALNEFAQYAILFIDACVRDVEFWYVSEMHFSPINWRTTNTFSAFDDWNLHLFPIILLLTLEALGYTCVMKYLACI